MIKYQVFKKKKKNRKVESRELKLLIPMIRRY